MARKFKLQKPDPKIYRSWTFVLIIGGLLAFLALVDRGGVASVVSAPADGQSVCQREVTIDNLNVRPTASLVEQPIETLQRGDRLFATATVTNGYRELRPGYWALDQHLAIVPGSPC